MHELATRQRWSSAICRCLGSASSIKVRNQNHEESCIVALSRTNLNQYMWNRVNHKSKSMSISHVPYMFHTSSILFLRWKDTYQTAKGGLQANVIAMISSQDNVQSSKSQNGPWNGATKGEHMWNHFQLAILWVFALILWNTWNYWNGNLQKKKDSIDTVVAGLRPASRSEYGLHFSSLFLIDFLLGTSRGTSLFTVASPQQNRAATWILIAWSAGQAQQSMFDQPRFDYDWLCSTIQFQQIKYPINKKTRRNGFNGFQNGLMTQRTSQRSVRNRPTAKSTTQYHMQWGAGTNWNVYVLYIMLQIICILFRFDGYLMESFVIVMPSPSLLWLRALLTGLALADWPVRDGRRREGLGSCIPSDISLRDVNKNA